MTTPSFTLVVLQQTALFKHITTSIF